jgi:hypothetical protein
MLILIVGLPLIPAILIYKIFPNTSIIARGNIGAITWNASGAFAAYVIVLMMIIMSPLMNIILSSANFYKPAWTVEATIHGFNYQYHPTNFKDINVIMRPDMHKISTGKAVLTIPHSDRSDWPIVTFTTTGGSKELDLSTLKENDIEIDYYNKRIVILNPVVIRQVPQVNKPYPPVGQTSYIIPGNSGD